MARLEQIRDAAEAVMKNAIQLYEEGQLLGSNGCFARAACLHQISNEECSKVDMLGAHATAIALGRETDQKKFEKALRNHAAKNHANAYFAQVGKEERKSMKEGDREKARREFKDLQEELHTWFNDTKNNSLYVNFEGGRLASTPQEISEELAVQMAALNRYFLNIADNHLSTLRELANNSSGERVAFMHRVVTMLKESQLDGSIDEATEEVMRMVRTEAQRVREEDDSR